MCSMPLDLINGIFHETFQIHICPGFLVVGNHCMGRRRSTDGGEAIIFSQPINDRYGAG